MTILLIIISYRICGEFHNLGGGGGGGGELTSVRERESLGGGGGKLTSLGERESLGGGGREVD